jgi:hypothetical protein
VIYLPVCVYSYIGPAASLGNGSLELLELEHSFAPVISVSGAG